MTTMANIPVLVLATVFVVAHIASVSNISVSNVSVLQRLASTCEKSYY